MPVYEYKCHGCDERFEQLVRSVDGDDGMKCPQCGSTKVERLLSVFAARDGGSAAPASACQQCGEAGGSCPFQ